MTDKPTPQVDPDDPRLVYMSEDEASAASGLCAVLRDRWFVVHPERGLVFFQFKRGGGLRGASPQCNSNENIARSIARMYPWAEVRLIPFVLVPQEEG